MPTVFRTPDRPFEGDGRTGTEDVACVGKAPDRHCACFERDGGRRGRRARKRERGDAEHAEANTRGSFTEHGTFLRWLLTDLDPRIRRAKVFARGRSERLTPVSLPTVFLLVEHGTSANVAVLA